MNQNDQPTNAENQQPQESFGSLGTLSVPGYTAHAVTLSDVGNNRIGLSFHVSEQKNPLLNRTYALDRKLAEELYEQLGAVLHS